MRDLTSRVDERLHAGLSRVEGNGSPVFAGSGVDPERVESLAALAASAHDYLSGLFGHRPPYALLVLGPDDWASRSAHPLYGMPNFRDGNLIVAGTSNPFWQGFIDVIAAGAPEHLPAVRATYARGDGRPDLTTFFDLLAVHELVHVFIADRGLRIPRLWLVETFCNMALHAYVAAARPGSLAELEAMPTAMAALDPGAFRFRRLAEFDPNYGVGMDPVNYGWFQSRFHRVAAGLFAAGGETLVRRAWDTFDSSDTVAGSDDAALADALGRLVHPAMREWIVTW